MKLATLTTSATPPNSTNMSAMPAPRPTPTSGPNTPANIPPGIIRGSNTRSASGPAANIAMGTDICAIIMRVPKTLPCTSCGTFVCQMASLQPLRNGIMSDPRNPETSQMGNVRPNPMSMMPKMETVSYTHLRAHETVLDIVCRLLLEKKT